MFGVQKFVREIPVARTAAERRFDGELVPLPSPASPTIPRHRPLPALIAEDQMPAHRERLEAELKAIDAELQNFPDHPSLLSALARCKGALRRIEDHGTSSRKLQQAEKALADASSKLVAPQRAVDELDLQLRDRQERQAVLQAQLEKLRADAGAAELDGKLTSKLRDQLANLEVDARINEAAMGTLLDRQKAAAATLAEAQTGHHNSKTEAESARAAHRTEQLKAAAMAAIATVNACTDDPREQHVIWRHIQEAWNPVRGFWE